MMLKVLLSIFIWFKINLNKLLKYKDLLAGTPTQINKQACGVLIRGGISTQDPLYPEGHPKRIEQESQLAENNITSSPKRKKKRKKHK